MRTPTMSWMPEGAQPVSPRSAAIAGVEIVAAVGVATGAIAALQSTAPATGLGVIYLLSVLVIAIRRGQLAALVTALLSMLALNYLFIPPRHTLTIAHSQDVVELVVLLIVAVVVGRLAAASRERAAEADSRAKVAAAREREARLLAEVASAILGGDGVVAQLEGIGERIARATAATGARVAIERVPQPGPGEMALPLRARTRTAWLYVSSDVSWERGDLERIAEPLGRLVDVAVEREQVAEREAEAEATKRADVARTAILHAISHDLRSPLTAMTTAGSALRAPDVTEAERLELIDVIEVEGARLAKLVDDLLDLSKIEAGAVAPQPDWCDLGDVVASAAAQVRTEHPIEFALPADLPLVRADASQLERVFSNLIQNAVKFSPPHAPVRITAGVGSGKVTVRVLDQGRGIPSQQRSHVFEPFYRGRTQPRGDSGSGSGLGLAICRGFVEANGGQIILQSRAHGGTSFAVSFPLVPQPEHVG
jgi:two-component system, OmpR family, sensor histidine kinase KdpD